MKIQGTATTPKIDFESDTGILSISGRCVPEDSKKFFNPLFDWIKRLEYSPLEELIVEIFIDYYNTASSAHILNLLKEFELVDHTKKSKAKIIWKYENDDDTMLEEGKHFSSLINLPFEFIGVPV